MTLKLESTSLSTHLEEVYKMIVKAIGDGTVGNNDNKDTITQKVNPQGKASMAFEIIEEDGTIYVLDSKAGTVDILDSKANQIAMPIKGHRMSST